MQAYLNFFPQAMQALALDFRPICFFGPSGLKVLSIEMDLAKIRFIPKVVIKE
jgi:hypothetical protein